MFALSTFISVYTLGGAEMLVGTSFLWEYYLISLFSVSSAFPWNMQKQFMAQVPEIACKRLFNGMQTNLCCVLFLMLVRAVTY